LARHPVAVECVQAAAAFGTGWAEVVVFDQGRAFVAATTSANGVLLPREMMAAEAALADSEDSNTCHAIDGWTAVPVRGPDRQLVGAVTVHTDHEDVPVNGLRALARILEGQLVSDTAPPTDFLHDVVNGQRDAVVVLGEDFTLRWVSDGVTSLLGRTPAELVGLSATDLVHPDDLVGVYDSVSRMQQGLEIHRVYVRLENASGVFMPIEITGNDLSENRNVDGLVLSLRDGQQDRELGAAMERTKRVSDAIVDGLRDGVIATDEYGAITAVNDTARDMFGIGPMTPPAQLTLADFSLVSNTGRPHNILSKGANPPEVCCLVSHGDDVRFITTSCQTITGTSDKRIGEVVVFTDITVEHRAAEELRDQALHDQLTGLANRRQLENKLHRLSLLETPVNIAACFIDLDGFKVVNDTHGHRIGDQLIRVAADRLAQEMRSEDLLVRQGGDEFVALLVDVQDLEEASVVAERYRSVLASPFTVARQRFDLTGSVGVAISRSDQLDADVLLQHADLALYAAKDGGRNRVERFDDELAAAALIEEQRRRLLRSALRDNRVEMHFQPLVDTATEATVGYEALARVRTLDDKLLSPASFLEGMTLTSLKWDLDRTAFELSCQAAALLAKVDSPSVPYVACNFSSVSINHPDFLGFLTDTIAEAGVEPHCISIELTESAAFEAGHRGAEALAKLREQGFLLALDDFGTGYSSLAHMRDLPISSIKVDRSFIERLAEDGSERSIAQAVVGLATDLGVEVVAEGVETAEQLHHAQEMGFSTIQGWHFSRALPLGDCLQDWAKNNAFSSPGNRR
jgi:diguanylate cyclase (GGDEF)-like protein/PAS domain S-box-containing protein